MTAITTTTTTTSAAFNTTSSITATTTTTTTTTITTTGRPQVHNTQENEARSAKQKFRKINNKDDHTSNLSAITCVGTLMYAKYKATLSIRMTKNKNIDYIRREPDLTQYIHLFIGKVH